MECIRTTVDVRLSHYEQEAQRLWKERRSEQRNVSSFFVDSEWTPEAQPSGPLSFFLIKVFQRGRGKGIGGRGLVSGNSF